MAAIRVAQRHEVARHGDGRQRRPGRRGKLMNESAPSEQVSIDLEDPKASTSPVECLGQVFEGEDARRAHFKAILAEKLKEPAFRETPGFPKGSDEAILRMSDPPYYTACPNPFLEDFVRAY